jgi:hypothetical protein
MKTMGAVFAAVILVGCLSSIPRVQADDGARDAEMSRIKKGFEISPVPLNLKGKDRELVGLGSYLINAVSTCNSCHAAGPATEYAANGNPYFNETPTKVNPETYLGGGQNFGKVGPPPSPNIISRNLTPDKTGRPEGGRTFQEFLRIMRTGIDLDNLHPNCSATITTNCFLPPTHGSLLQVMPWPHFQNMSDHDLLAMYTYLSAIPCLSAGNPGDELYNDCGP